MTVTDWLVSEIEAAFAEATFPCGLPISLPTYDDEGTTKYFSGKSWRGHSAKALRSMDFALCVFTPEAFAYYAPAFMLADLENTDEADTIPEAFLFWLSPLGGNPDRAHRISSLLSPQQRHSVCSYLDFVSGRDGMIGSEKDLYEAAKALLSCGRA